MGLVTQRIQGADGELFDIVLDKVGVTLYPVYKMTVGALGKDGQVVSAANPMPVRLTDGTLDFELDPLTGYQVVIDAFHHKIHEEEAFGVCQLFLAVASTANADLRITVGANKNLHLTFSVASILKGNVFFYEGTTFSANGTTVASFNLNRTSAVVSDATFRYTPTVNVLGTLLPCLLLPAGDKINQSAGSGVAGREELILVAGKEYLIRVTNTGAQASDIGITASWYEADP